MKLIYNKSIPLVKAFIYKTRIKHTNHMPLRWHFFSYHSDKIASSKACRPNLHVRSTCILKYCKGSTMKKQWLSMFFILLTTSLIHAEMSNDDIAKASQNPVTMLYSLPIQNNTYFDLGGTGETKNVANFQPVIPMDLSEDWDMVWRLIMPVVSTPVGTQPTNPVSSIPGTDFEQIHALGDSTLTAYLSPKKTDKFIWGAGAALYIPTATDDKIKTDQWGGGVSFVGLSMQERWTYGALVMNVWSFGTDKKYSDTKIDFFQLQPFVNYNMGNGWFLTSVPIITALWDKENKERWTVPLGGGIGKGFKIGKLPVSANAQAFYNVVTPETFGETWQLRLQAQVFFPRK